MNKLSQVMNDVYRKTAFPIHDKTIMYRKTAFLIHDKTIMYSKTAFPIYFPRTT